MNITVVGAGYVGLVQSAGLAELGHHVTAIEIDPARLAALRGGRLPIHEPGLNELVERNVAAGRLRFEAEFSAALDNAQHAFVAVPTPALESGHPDTRHVLSAAREIFEHAPRDLILVVKSTVPAGTGEEIAQLGLDMKRRDVPIVSNPEFLRQGSAVRDFFEPDRIVIGAQNEVAAEGVARLYAGIDAPIVSTSRRSAELAKYAANALLATRISFINEIAAVCEVTGANVDEVAHIVGLDDRIGPHFLRAGLGWGGSCFPKDVLALASMASRHGGVAPILEAVLTVNERQRDIAVERILDATSNVSQPRVAVLGLSFKPDTDDLRGSPAIDIIERLVRSGIEVHAHDPVAIANARRVLPQISYHDDAYATAKDVDVILLATEWQHYLDLDWRRMRRRMRGSMVLDGRNVLDEDALRAIGFRYVAFGRGRVDGHALVELGGHRPDTGSRKPTQRRKPDRVRVADSAA